MAGIIIEGAEQTGKSTLCRQLATKLGFELVHMHKDYGYVDGVFDYYSGYFYDIDRRPGNYVYDRSYVSELVYGSLFKRDNIDAQLQGKIERRFAELGYVFVLCHWDGDWIDREETVTQEQNRVVAATYDRVFETVSLPKLRLCPRRETDAIDRVVGLLKGI